MNLHYGNNFAKTKDGKIWINLFDNINGDGDGYYCLISQDDWIDQERGTYDPNHAVIQRIHPSRVVITDTNLSAVRSYRI